MVCRACRQGLELPGLIDIMLGRVMSAGTDFSAFAPAQRQTVEAELRRLLLETKPPPKERNTDFSSRSTKRRLILNRASDIAPEKVKWLWPGRIARGKHTTIAGDPGTGKSQVMISIVAAVTTGGELPCDEGRAPCGSVIILAAEDGIADTIVPRLLAAGADLTRVHVVTATHAEGDTRSFNLQADLDLLEQMIEAIGDVCLVCIYPISSYLGKVDSHKYIVRPRGRYRCLSFGRQMTALGRKRQIEAVGGESAARPIAPEWRTAAAADEPPTLFPCVDHMPFFIDRQLRRYGRPSRKERRTRPP